MNAQERLEMGLVDGYLNQYLPPAMPNDEDYMRGWAAGCAMAEAFKCGWTAAVLGRPYVELAHEDRDLVLAYRSGYFEALRRGYGQEVIHDA